MDAAARLDPEAKSIVPRRQGHRAEPPWPRAAGAERGGRQMGREEEAASPRLAMAAAEEVLAASCRARVPSSPPATGRRSCSSPPPRACSAACPRAPAWATPP